MSNGGGGASMRLDTDSESVLELAARHQRPLIIGVIAVAALAGGGWFYMKSKAIRESRAVEALVVGEAAFSTGDAERAKTELERVFTRYAGTSAGTQAALLYAQISFEAGQADSGLAKLRTISGKTPRHLRAAVLAMQGAGEALAGRTAEGAALYERAGEAAEFRPEAEQYRMEAARLHVAAGNVAAAKAIYEAIADREDSANAGEARVRLGEIALKS